MCHWRPTVDGEERITARLADRFNNPVPDGTSVVFRTEYGAIDSSCLTGEANGKRVVEAGNAVPNRGTCSVLWTSQNPRLPTLPFDEDEATTDRDGYICPSHDGAKGPCPDDLGLLRVHRSTVVAYVLGEEDFIDANGNGLYDAGEEFVNLPEAFIDFNEDDVYTPFADPDNPGVSGAEEEFIDLDGDGLYDDGDDPRTGSMLYNGTLCTNAAESALVCSRDLINVRGDLVLTLSSGPSEQKILFVQTENAEVVMAEDSLKKGDRYAVYIADEYNNRPGDGSELQISLDNDKACNVFIQGETLGAVDDDDTDDGDGSEDSTTLTINSSGFAPGALTISPLIVTKTGSGDGVLSFSIDGEFIEDIECN